MSRNDPESAFNEIFIARTKALRMERGLLQAEMADKLAVSLDRYKKYETRSPLPHYLIEPFAEVVGRDVTYVLTGKLRARPRS